jgi:hypothetical protein
MAINFRIFVHRNGENLHLKLIGDFDGTSAHELLSVLKRYCNRISRVFIHTSCLRDIHALGRNVFQANLDVLNGQSITLVFTGENASKLAPEKPMFSDLMLSTIPLVDRSGATISSPRNQKRFT